MFNILLPFIIELFELLEQMLQEPKGLNVNKKPKRKNNSSRIDFLDRGL